MSTAQRVALVVDDSRDFADLLVSVIGPAGFTVHRAFDGAAAVAEVERLRPDLVTLDLGLPDMDGVEVCRRIRRISDCYVIMLTGRDEEIDRLISLEAGADDYITKPMSVRELRARISAMFRRPRTVAPGADAEDPAPPIDGGGRLVIDPAARTVAVDGVEVDLTRTEFELLLHLAGNIGRACSREELINALWGTDYLADGHLVSVHVGNLRRKLAEHSTHAWIRTLRGIGYRFDPAG